MTAQRKKLTTLAVAAVLFLMVFLAMGLGLPTEVQAAGSLNSTIPTQLTFTANVYQSTPMSDKAGQTTVIYGENYTLTRFYNATVAESSQALIEVKGKMTIWNLTIDGNSGMTWDETNGLRQSSPMNKSNQPLIRVHSGGQLILLNCTVKNSYATVSGAGIKIDAGGSVRLVNTAVETCRSTSSGGGIHNLGTLSIARGKVWKNASELSGGGIYSAGNMYIGKHAEHDPGVVDICWNVAAHGGGIACGTTVNGGGETWIYGTAGYPVYIRDNAVGTANNQNYVTSTASSKGGGIYLQGGNTHIYDNVFITGNSAGLGGGVYGYGFYIGRDGTSRVEISGNSALDAGGGVYAHKSAEIGRADIISNTAKKSGGGVYISSYAVQAEPVALTAHTKVKNNTVASASYLGGGGVFADGYLKLIYRPYIAGNKSGTSTSALSDDNLCLRNGVVLPATDTMWSTSDSGEKAPAIGVSVCYDATNKVDLLKTNMKVTDNWSATVKNPAWTDVFTVDVPNRTKLKLSSGDVLLDSQVQITLQSNAPGLATQTRWVTYRSVYTFEENPFGDYPGHELTTWNGTVGTAASYAPGQTINAIQDYTFTAQWKDLIYFLRYNYNGGEGAITQLQLYYGTSVTLATPKPRSGYTHLGWDPDPNATTPEFAAGSTINYPYTEDKTLYAIWALNGTKLTLDANGGTGTTTTNLPVGQSIAERFTAPTRQKYFLAGFTLTKGGDDLIMDAYGTLSSLVTGYTDANGRWIYEGDTLTLYAKWDSAVYRVFFYTLVDGKYTVARFSDGQTIEYPTPQKSGCTLEGWYTRDGRPFAFTTMSYDLVKEYGLHPDDINAKIELEANWVEMSAASIQLVGTLKTAYLIGESFSAGNATLTLVYDNGETEKNIPITTDMLSGFSTDAQKNNATATITYGGKSLSFTYSVKKPAYAVSYNAGGATGTLPAAQQVAAGDTFTVPSGEKLALTGYRFTGWKASTDGKTYAVGASFTMPDGPVTFTSTWALSSPTISSLTMDGLALTYNEYNVAQPSFTFDGKGHTFTVTPAHSAQVTYTYKWYRQTSGEAIPPYFTDESYYANCTYLGNTPSLTCTQVADGGTYYCLITATHGANTAVVRATIFLTVVPGEAEITMSRMDFTYSDGLTIDLGSLITTSDGADYTLTVDKGNCQFSYAGGVISKITKAGSSFTVTVQKAASENCATSQRSFTVNLQKGTQSISIVEPADTYYVGTTYTFALSGAKGPVGFGCSEHGTGVQLTVLSNGVVTVTNRGEDGRVVLAAEAAATDLYNTAKASLTFYVEKAPATVPNPKPSDLSICVESPLSAVTLPAGYSWKDSSTVLGTVGNQKATAIYTPADTVNYTAVELELSVAVKAHTGGEATCQQKATCSVCYRAYGELAGCRFSDTYLAVNADASKHYHVCTVCGKKDAGAAHTPNIPAATEQSAKICTVCEYVMAGQLAHVHAYREVAEGKYLKTAATCTASAVYYKSCACGQMSDATFVSGGPDKAAHTGTVGKLSPCGNGTHNVVYSCCEAVVEAGIRCAAVNADDSCLTAEVCTCGYILNPARSTHDFTTAYAKDADGHWHICRYCKAADQRAPHAPKADDGNCTTAIHCSACDYVTTPGRAEHTWDEGYQLSNATAERHYHVCTVPGCQIRDGGVAHTPNIPAATEQSAKVCTACTYVLEPQLAHTHRYTELPKDTCRLTAATCTKSAVYYKSCVCGQMSTETFSYGSADPHAHTGSPSRLYSKEGTHDVLYTCCQAVHTSDIPCLSAAVYDDCTKQEQCICGYITKAAGTHIMSQTPTADAEGHWHICENCSITDQKQNHTPAEDDGDCTTPIRCTVCDHSVIPGRKTHTFDTGYALSNADKDKHYHVCTESGCTIRDGGEAHTPNIPAATEQSAQYCTACRYILAAQLGHTHVYTEMVTLPYLKAPATCTAPAVYYTSCTCGDRGDETFESGASDAKSHTGTATALVPDGKGHHDRVYTCCSAIAEGGIACTATLVDDNCLTAEICRCGHVLVAARDRHDFSGAYRTDEDGHWHICRHCPTVDTRVPHTPNIPAPTESEAQSCTACGYELAPALTHVHVYREIMTDAYKLQVATCRDQAVYVKSCTCGQRSEETFVGGVTDPQNHASGDMVYVPGSAGSHERRHSCCQVPAGSEACSGGNATCMAPATCTFCDRTYGEPLAHRYTTLEQDATHHWYACATCAATDGRTEHIYGNGDTCTTCNHQKPSAEVTTPETTAPEDPTDPETTIPEDPTDPETTIPEDPTDPMPDTTLEPEDPATEPETKPADKGGCGTIIGISIGLSVLLIVAAVAVFILLRKRSCKAG